MDRAAVAGAVVGETRYDKTATSYEAAVCLASFLL